MIIHDNLIDKFNLGDTFLISWFMDLIWKEDYFLFTQIKLLWKQHIFTFFKN